MNEEMIVTLLQTWIPVIVAFISAIAACVGAVKKFKDAVIMQKFHNAKLENKVNELSNLVREVLKENVELKKALRRSAEANVRKPTPYPKRGE